MYRTTPVANPGGCNPNPLRAMTTYKVTFPVPVPDQEGADPSTILEAAQGAVSEMESYLDSYDLRSSCDENEVCVQELKTA